MPIMRNEKQQPRVSESGFSVVELVIAIVIVTVLTAISLPYLYSNQRLYKSEDQALKILDLMGEANKQALAKRRTFRVEIDLTDNAAILIDENGTAADTRVRWFPLEKTFEVRADIIPDGVTRPDPPNYNDAAFADDTLGHQWGPNTKIGNTVWAARFRSDGSVVNAADIPISATLYIWPPEAAGSDLPRSKTEVRAITMFGGSGAIRYWKHNGTVFYANS